MPSQHNNKKLTSDRSLGSRHRIPDNTEHPAVDSFQLARSKTNHHSRPLRRWLVPSIPDLGSLRKTVMPRRTPKPESKCRKPKSAVQKSKSKQETKFDGWDTSISNPKTPIAVWFAVTHQRRIVGNNDKIGDGPRHCQYQRQCHKQTERPARSRYDNRRSIHPLAQYKHVPQAPRTTAPEPMKVSDRTVLCYFTLPSGRHSESVTTKLRWWKKCKSTCKTKRSRLWSNKTVVACSFDQRVTSFVRSRNALYLLLFPPPPPWICCGCCWGSRTLVISRGVNVLWRLLGRRWSRCWFAVSTSHRSECLLFVFRPPPMNAFP